MRGRPNTPEDFWSQVLKSTAHECWPWQGGYFPDGYGFFKWRGRQWRAPRVAYHLTHPDFDLRQCVLHRCDNPACCNPQHLFAGTKGDNNRDRAAKGRTRPNFGERHHNSKLTEPDVRAIRHLYATGDFTQHRLGRMFGVTQTVVGDIVRRVAWPHVA